MTHSGDELQNNASKNHQLNLTLPEIRTEITAIDEKILNLLTQRRDLSRCVALNKASSQKPIRDQHRELELLESLVEKGATLGLDSYYVTSLFHNIIEDSLAIQKAYLQTETNPLLEQNIRLNIAVLGGQGAYSYLAACKHFKSSENTYLGCSSFDKVLKSVEQGKAEFGVIPIENSTSGAITEVYDLLLDSQLSIVGEEKYSIRHCLITKDHIALNKITKIFAHPEASRQCNKKLKQQLSADISLVSSTAEALKRVKEDTSGCVAAIASEKSALEFSLSVLLKDIADLDDNTTRFLIVAQKPINVSPQIDCKTSVALSTSQKPGALAEVLLVFRDAKLPLNRLESRPIAGKPWEQMFYLDFAGNRANDKVTEALEKVAKLCHFIKILGSYPSANINATQVSANALSKSKLFSGLSAHEKHTKTIHRRASRDYKTENTLIEIKDVKLGGDNFVIIGGPSAVETAEQINACAKHAKETGVAILRGDCFKPPIYANQFVGIGFEGLDHLHQAAKNYALPIMTQVTNANDVKSIATQADILQISARNMQNFALLKAVGQTNTPVMLKRGHMSSIEELLNSAEYILSQGNKQVILCEQGSRTFETATRNTIDFSAIPLIKQMSHLPIIVAPSHAVGKRSLVIPMAKAAKAVGAHGIMVEFHPTPSSAICGGQQALDFNDFAKMMYDLHAENTSTKTNL